MNYLYLILLLAFSGCDKFAVAQSAPDVIVNQDSVGTVVENQNFQNLYDEQQQTANTVTAFLGSFTNGKLDTNFGGTQQNSSLWPSGDIVYMSATGVWNHAPISSFHFQWTPNNIQTFTSSGTWVQPSGCVKPYIKVIGAGGNGGKCASVSGGNASYGGGGGAGGYTEGVINVNGDSAVTIGTTNIFSGVTAIQSTQGTNGSNGSGSGGQAIAGTGGSGTNGDINANGQDGYLYLGGLGPTGNSIGSGGKGCNSGGNGASGSNGDVGIVIAYC